VKIFLVVISVLLLCACSTTPVFESSINGFSYTPAPTNLNDPRLSSPQFYMDDDKSPVARYYQY
jgi:hypothetical protein